MKTNILWLRNDLRLEDNTALIQAVESSYKENVSLTLLFHINTEQVKVASYSNDYFFSALYVFYKKLKDLAADLLFLYGEPETTFKAFLAENKNINKLFFNFSERGYGLKRDKKVLEIFKENNIEVVSFLDKHLHSAEEVLTADGNNYKVFTPYYRKWAALPKKSILQFDKEKFKSLINNEFANPNKAEFDSILEKRKYNLESICGEEQAAEELREFVEYNLANYHDIRDDIFLNATSKMSKYLTTGQISIRQIYYVVLELEYSKGAESYLRQLAWRDFYNMIYHYNPEQDKQEIIEKYRFIKWNDDKYAFNIWKYGLTGYPLVDAAMRNLRQTGEMQNRLRMIAASFLVKDLLIDWRMGEAYFKEILLDYDSASNIGSWQWVASTGTDACPYFRVFNPTTQAKKFDKKGTYIKSILPELNDVESKYIHEPHKSKVGELDYPQPIVIHKEQRLKILEMYTSSNPYHYSTNMKNEFIKRYTLYGLSKLKNASKKQLIDFHSENKYLYFTYNITIKNKLGKILAEKRAYTELYTDYKKTLIQLFEQQPTVKKTINAYQHIYGYFKNKLMAEEIEEYHQLLERYREDNTCNDDELRRFFNQLANKYQIDYIQNQSLLREF